MKKVELNTEFGWIDEQQETSGKENAYIQWYSCEIQIQCSRSIITSIYSKNCITCYLFSSSVSTMSFSNEKWHFVSEKCSSQSQIINQLFKTPRLPEWCINVNARLWFIASQSARATIYLWSTVIYDLQCFVYYFCTVHASTVLPQSAMGARQSLLFLSFDHLFAIFVNYGVCHF